MKELNQEQHIQLLQFMSLMQTCKTEEELQALKEQYFNIPRYEFLQDYISEKSENQSLSSYKTSLIYEMDKYQHDYKIVYGENFPAYKKETMPNNKADYTVIHLLNEISECDDIEAYQKLMEEKNRFPRVKIEALSHEFTGIYFSSENELPTNIILNSPESNFNARRQLVEAGYSPFTLPSVEDVRENGFEWLHEEISHFKETLNPNFIEQETQRNQEPEFNEQEYEEEYDDFIEPMDENDGMSAMAAEADYNGSLIENEDIDEVQHQIDIDNGLIDENENEIMYDGSESEQEENFEEYIHSEKFISKFGDWEKANRLEKLRNAESIIKDGKITLNNSDITETVESLIDNEDRKGLQSLEKEIGKNILGVYVNPDTGLTINVSNRNVTEISNHHYLFKEHIQSLSFIPEIIDKAILIGEVENEDKQKHPNIEKYLYFGTGIKIDGVDYTCKSVVGIDKNNNCYYDQSLSTIEKGRLVDYIFKNEKVGNLSPLITQRETDLEGNDLPYVYYDKRLINICQVPQMPYLEKNTITGKWQPTKEAVEAVKNGALFVEKQGQTYGMNERELKITNKVEQENKIMDSVENKKYLQEADFEKYIHSEEFISKFGDWEKASRLQKLSEAPSIIKNGRVIIEGEDVTEEVNNFRNDEDNKVLRIFAKDIGRSVKGTYHNDDLDIDVVLSMGNIDEIKNHHMAMSGHLEAIQYIPDIIKQGIYIAEEPNEDKTKHPNIEKYKYFVSTLKIDGVDYTCKSAIGVDKDGNHYYDQRLSQIEKGLLLDNLSQLMSRGKSEQSLLNYDKRLLRICQCPQSLYLDKELKPTKEAIKLVKTGKLYLEKDKNGFQLLHDIDKNKIIGKELSEMIEKNMPDTIDSKHDVQNGSDMSQDNVSNILDTPTNSMKVNESLNTEFSNNDIPVENKKYLRNSEITQSQDVSLFDKELQKFIDGKLPKSHIFSLGKPSEILVKCGFPAEQRIELSASHLEFKSKLPRHTFDLEEIKGLEKALQNPIAVFEYGDRKKSQNIIINIEKDGKNFLAGVHFNQSTRGYEVSDIRTLYPKENVEWLNWINQGKLIYGDKEKLQALIAQQRMNVAEVNSQVAQSPLYEHCLESSSSILDKFGEVKDIFTDEYPFYEDVKKKAAIEQKFFNYYVTKGNLDARELSVFESEEFYNALISGDAAKIDEYTKTDLHEINELAAEIYEEYSKDNEIENTQKVSDMSQDSISNIFNTPTNSMKVNESLNTEFSNNDIPVENNEVEQEPEPENEPQNYENNNSNVSAPKPKNKQELHQFFINNPYTSGTPVPTIAMRNEQTGHSTFIEGYEFARLEDIGKPNPAFRDENGKQIKPDGQTVVLTKPAFKEVIDEETGEKKLVPDDKNRKFIRISRDLYEQAIKNSEIIAKRNPKTEQEKQKMLDDYLEAAHLDEKKQRANTASNFWHNYKAGVMTIANNKQEAMAFAKRLVIEMIPSEREKFAAMVRKYEKLRGTDGKHLSYDQRIIDFYDNMGLKITNNSIWRDHVDEKYNTLDAIKQNTEVFDKEGQPLDKSCRMKIGDTIKMSVTVDSALSNKKIKLPIQEYRLVAHSKDNNSVALISADGKQKIIKNREDFIKEVQKVEKKLMKKQQREDRYESISM